MKRKLVIYLSILLLPTIYLIYKYDLFKGKSFDEDMESKEVEAPLERVITKNESVKGALKQPQVENKVKTESKFSKSDSKEGRHKKEEMIEQVIRVSGIEKQLLGVDELLDQKLEEIFKTPSGDDSKSEKFLEIYRKNLASKNILKFVKDRVDESFNKEELEEINNLYNDPIVQLISKVEEENGTAQGMSGFAEYVKDLNKETLPEERKEIIEELGKTTRTVENHIDLTSKLSENIMVWHNKTLPEDKRVPEGDIKKNFAIFKDVLGEKLKEQLNLSMAYTYRDLSDQELKDYTTFNKKPLISKMRDVTQKATSEAFETAGKNIGKETI